MSSFLEVSAGPSVPGQCWTRGEELSVEQVGSEKVSPSLKKVDRGAFAGLQAWWRLHFWFLSVACGEDSGSWP